MKKNSSFKMALAVAGLSAALSGSALAEMQIDTHGGLKVWDPCNPCYWFCINGRLELDEVYYSGTYRDRAANYPSSGNIRLGRLAFKGGVGEDLSYNVTLDFGRTQSIWTNTANGAQLTTNAPYIHGLTLIEEAWLAYTGLWECTRIRFGQFTPLATIDDMGNYGTANGQMFMESALATRAFSVPSFIDTDSRSRKGLGVVADGQILDMFTLAAAVYQPATSAFNNYGDPGRSDRWGGSLRATFSPIHECDQAYHIGVLARFQDMNSTRFDTPVLNTLFFTTPEVVARNYIGNPRNFSANTTLDPNLLNTGALRARNYTHYAADVLALYGPFTFEGEYHHAFVGRKDQTNVQFRGGHAQVGYVLTGESRCYDFVHGALGGIKPCGEWGAWEIVARYSSLTLNNKNVFGGYAGNATVGINWYVNDNVRFAFNYIRSTFQPTGTIAGTATNPLPIKRRLDIFAGRLQIIF